MLGKKINDISVVHRLYIGFAILTLVIAAGGGGAFLLAQTVNSSFNTLTENSAKTQLLANQIGSQALRAGIQLLGLENAANLEELQRINGQAEQALSSLDSLVRELGAHAQAFDIQGLKTQLDDVERVKNTLSSQGRELAQQQSLYLEQDQKVRDDLSQFLFQLSDMKRSVTKVVASAAAEDSYIEDILALVMERFGLMEFLLSNMVNTREPDKIADLVQKIQYNNSVFNDDFSSLVDEVEALSDPQIQELLAEFNRQLNQPTGIVARYIASQQTIENIFLQTSQINQQLAGLDVIVTDIVQLANSQSAEASAQGKSLISQARSITVVVVPLVILFAIAVAYWLASLIRKPLEHTQSQILKLAEGIIAKPCKASIRVSLRFWWRRLIV
ncbi:hypothetical protein [Agarivorans gilvus]|uniref:hypothetical protein n=1 Tax=Agarivorans gilvus TaxID=680279 RepID=UPI0006EC0EBB|nr:hypothetical protein [Agarivorans gilvus]